MKSKKATILIENVVFIVVNLLFLAILILFIAKQGSGAIELEQVYAKQIALIIDSAKPVSIVELNMEKGFNIAEKNGIDPEDVVEINNREHYVLVRMDEKSGYRYSFFNHVNVTEYPKNSEGRHIFTINQAF